METETIKEENFFETVLTLITRLKSHNSFSIIVILNILTIIKVPLLQSTLDLFWPAGTESIIISKKPTSTLPNSFFSNS